MKKVKVSQLYLTVCKPMDCTVHGILQARILENWVAIPFSRGSSQPRDRTQVSCIAGGFFTIGAPGKPKNTGVGSHSLLQGMFPFPGDLPNPGIEPRSPALQVDSFQLIHKGSSRMLEWVAYPFSRDLPHPRIEPVSSALHANSLPTKLSHNLSFV